MPIPMEDDCSESDTGDEEEEEEPLQEPSYAYPYGAGVDGRSTPHDRVRPESRCGGVPADERLARLAQTGMPAMAGRAWSLGTGVDAVHAAAAEAAREEEAMIYEDQGTDRSRGDPRHEDAEGHPEERAQQQGEGQYPSACWHSTLARFPSFMRLYPLAASSEDGLSEPEPAGDNVAAETADGQPGHGDGVLEAPAAALTIEQEPPDHSTNVDGLSAYVAARGHAHGCGEEAHYRQLEEQRQRQWEQQQQRGRHHHQVQQHNHADPRHPDFHRGDAFGDAEAHHASVWESRTGGCARRDAHIVAFEQRQHAQHAHNQRYRGHDGGGDFTPPRTPSCTSSAAWLAQEPQATPHSSRSRFSGGVSSRPRSAHGFPRSGTASVRSGQGWAASAGGHGDRDLAAAWAELERARQSVDNRERAVAAREAAVKRAEARNLRAAQQNAELRQRLDDYNLELEEGMASLQAQQARHQVELMQLKARRICAAEIREQILPSKVLSSRVRR